MPKSPRQRAQAKEPPLTYCGNVHPAADLEGWLAALQQYSLPVARGQRQRGVAFGLGSWWSARTAQELACDPRQLQRLLTFLHDQDLQIWTLNLFPYGRFHGEPVKEKVYQPDWSTEERLLYTRHAAEVMAKLYADQPPPGRSLALSTLPLGHAGGEGDLRRMAHNLTSAASHLEAIEAESGLSLILCLEPEPYCLLETVAGTLDFLEQWVFRQGAGIVGEATLRRHLGICMDLCHLAVLGEDAIEAMAAMQARGVCCGKIQVSSCLELRDPKHSLDQLLAFDEPVYLHQSISDTGLRALDLDELRRRRAEFETAGEIRTHFHLPVYWDQPGAVLGSSRRQLERVLEALPRPLPLLEVETYTWGVLPAWQNQEQDLVSGLLKELEWVGAQLWG